MLLMRRLAGLLLVPCFALGVTALAALVCLTIAGAAYASPLVVSFDAIVPDLAARQFNPDSPGTADPGSDTIPIIFGTERATLLGLGPPA